jgi:predicted alternative tryptophan synthase beta-subunit
MHKQFKFMLEESDIPKAWCNISADMPVHLVARGYSSHRE